ncbi:MAG: cache domain-containing protein [Candidatus Auribacterota bacterium]
MKKQALKLAVLLTCVLSLSLAGKSMALDLTPQSCKDVADKAAKLIAEKGEAAFADLKNKEGEFIFADGQGYVWVQDADSMMLMHPIKPDLDGKSLADFQDLNGMYIFVVFSEMAEDNGSGWVPYSWPKPGQDSESPKISYVVKTEHGGKTYIVGCGMYDVTAADIKAQFPDDAVYEE